jgi:hypothetical protein
MVIKVGQIWFKHGPEWSDDTIGAPVIVVGVRGNEVQYRYVRLFDSYHGCSGGWTTDIFEKAFRLLKDVE